MNPTALHGGLVFSGSPDQALNRCAQIAAAALRDAGHAVIRVSRLSGQQARVSSEASLIKLSLERLPADGEAGARALRLDKAGGAHPLRAGRAPYRMELSLTLPGSETPARTGGERLLVTLLFNMTRATDAAFVEWLAPEARLPARRFMDTLQPKPPRALTPELMPHHAPLLLTDAFVPKPADPQPDQTLSLNLREVFRDGAAPRPVSGARPGIAATLSSALDSGLELLRGAPARLGAPAMSLAAILAVLPQLGR